MSESAIERYKSSVSASATGETFAEPTTEMLVSIGKRRVDFDADVAKYQRRVKAAEDLARLPEREREVRELEKLAAMAADCEHADVAKYKTIGELFEALETFRTRRTGEYVSDEKLAAHQAKMELRNIRPELLRILSSTADPAINQEIQELNTKIGGIQRGIAFRRELSTLEARIKNQEDFSPGWSRGRGRFQRPAAELLKEGRAKLAELISMRRTS